MKKLVNVLALGFLFTSLYAEPNVTIDLTMPEIPNTIRYQQVSEEENRLAINYLQKIIGRSEEELFSNLPKMIQIGPRWWAELSRYPQFKNTAIPTQILVPVGNTVYKLESAIINTEINIKNILIIFMSMWEQSTDITIRRLNQDELNYYWSICSYDLTEPLFVVESTHGTYIFDFTTPNELFFVENVVGLR